MMDHPDDDRAARRRVATAFFILSGVVVSIACDRTVSSAPPPPATSNGARPATPSLVTGDSALGYPDVPNTLLTPGAALPVTAADICVPGYTRRVRSVPIAVKRQAYAIYGIRSHAPGEYEVDHLISLEFGGSNSIRNLWPESFRTHPWNAYVKDALENELHRRVCAGTIDLTGAQYVISHNWVIGYRNYVHSKPPSANARKPRSRRRRKYTPPRSQFDSPVP